MEPLAAASAPSIVFASWKRYGLIIGAGAVGFLFVPLLIDRSAVILAADLRPERLQLARNLGGCGRFSGPGRRPGCRCRDYTQGRRADLVI